MSGVLAAYGQALAGLLVLAVLVTVQFLVADVAGIRARHVPGMPVTSGHKDFFFRANRAIGNTNEQLPLFLLIVLPAMLIGARPAWIAIGVWVFVAARAAHMAFYYADLRALRSTAFTIGTLAQIGLLVVAVIALFGA